MAKGENIFKRKDGRWEARYIKGRDVSGKIKYGYCYGKTYKEAKEKVGEYKAALICGQSVPEQKEKYLFSYYCDAWLETIKLKCKESTYVKYSNILKKHIKPQLGEYYPMDITNHVIELFQENLLYKEELAPKTVKDILVMLRLILKYTEIHSQNVFSAIQITYPKDTKKEMKVLSIPEQERLISYLMTDMDDCKFGVLLALNTGIRIGELCALRWDCISLKDKTIKINATMQRLQNLGDDGKNKTKIIIGPPKSDTSLRVIPLSDACAELCEKMNPNDDDAYILTGTTAYMEPRALQYRLKKYTKECGLEDIHFHILRHTFATRCMEVGFEIKSLSEILGHSTTTITLNRYVHSSMEFKRDNMNKLMIIAK